MTHFVLSENERNLQQGAKQKPAEKQKPTAKNGRKSYQRRASNFHRLMQTLHHAERDWEERRSGRKGTATGRKTEREPETLADSRLICLADSRTKESHRTRQDNQGASLRMANIYVPLY